MDKQLILSFLEDLSKHNSKEWMDKNRDRYKEAKNIWLEEIKLILGRIAKHDPALRLVQPKNTISRITNNRRFHPDKPVYTDTFTFTPYKNIHSASFHISISPAYSFIGGGLYHADNEQLNKVREAIDYDGDELKKIVADKNYKKLFSGLDNYDDDLRTSPKGYKKDHKHIDLLKRKNLTSRVEIKRKQFLSDKFADLAEHAFILLKPMIDYLNKAIGFEE